VRRGVAVMAVTDRLDGGFLDVRGRLEVGLADAEVDDVAALGGERVGARQHREGVLLADAVEVRHGSKHWDFLFLFSFPSPACGRGCRAAASGEAGEGSSGTLSPPPASLPAPLSP